MKKFWILLIVILPFWGQSQEDLTFVDPTEQLNTIYDLYNEGKNLQALELLKNVDERDSVYATYQYLKASIFIDEEDYEKAIAVCTQSNDFGELDASIRLTHSVALLRLEKYNECKDVLDTLLAKYPANNLGYFNRALVYENLDEHKKAAEDFKTCIILNPFEADPHLQLGKICYNEGLISQAMMCFDSYLYLQPNDKNSLSVLTLLNAIVSEKNEGEPKNITVSADDEAFREIDLMISNYTALNKKYKITNDIDLPLVRQNQAMMEMLSNYEGNDGFWSRKYVPFYQSIYNAGKFDETEHIFCSKIHR
ncbi:MAG TPA: hypothetical protein P5514_07830, partial [Bacteroidales bacterium]|nr:hypothetical protein [Bacteroidales bacterium]